MSATLGLLLFALLAGVVGGLLGWAGARLRRDEDPVVERINRLLPQTQCAQCGYPGCRPYAEAIARGEADINQCPPGGDQGVRDLAQLLGREVRQLSLHQAVDAPLSADARLGETEVDELHLTGVGQEHVPRVDVSMDHGEWATVLVGELVRRVQPRGHLRADPRAQAVREAPAPLDERVPQVRERATRQELHGDEAMVARDPVLERADDVGVREAREDLGFVREHAEVARVATVLVADHLERDELLTPVVCDPAPDVHVGHAAAADPRADLVAAQRHGRRGALW